MTNPPPQLRYHRKYLDPSLVQFGERYFENLRHIHRGGTRHFNKTVVTAQYIALLRIDGNHLHVTMIPVGESYFEFMTSGRPLRYWTFSQGSITGQGYYTGVVGVGVTEGRLVPVLRTGERVQHTVLGASRIKRGNQVILLDEPVHYYGPAPAVGTKESWNYPRQLYDAWAPLHPHSGLYYHNYHNSFQILTVHTQLGSYAAHFLRDIGYDVLWGDNKGLDPLREAALTDTPSDWPRQTGVQIVQHAVHGSREFAIYVDAFDQVSVFPTAKIGPLGAAGGAPLQNVDPMYVKRARVTFPSWVYKKNQTFKSWFTANSGAGGAVATGLYQFPEIDWKLHPDSTVMCAVVHEYIEAQLDTAYYAPYASDVTSRGPGSFWPNASSFNTMNAVTCGAASMHAAFMTVGDTYYQAAPGLMKVEILVEITGPNAEDFSLTLTSQELRRPTTTPYCTFLAGYVGHDIRAKDYTSELPKYDARRGDLCVLDIECYGNLATNKAANLYSLKNLHTGTGTFAEINTFGASSGFTAGAMFSGVPSVVASDMRTLSFAFKYRNEVVGGSPEKRDMYFGIGVYTLNRHRQTFFPDTMPEPQKAAIRNKVSIDHRMAMIVELPGLTLMPLNDLRDWTDPDLAALRERYTRSLSKAAATTPYGVYAGNPTPYINEYIADVGFKYWQTGSYAFTPSTAAQNWYNVVVRHGLLKPYILFDLITPRPGWWQYSGHITQRLEINPHTTFFAHPNGSWAFFCQDMIYNGNGLHVVPLGSPGLGTAEWDATKMEHCIFDQVVLVSGKGTAFPSSFRALYNQAVKEGKDAGLIKDDTAEIALADMKATFVLGTIPDPNDPSITYAQMRLNWPVGYTAYYREMAYFSGTKSGNFDGRPIGGALDLSMSSLWKINATDASFLTAPCTVNTPITFSTCVLITK